MELVQELFATVKRSSQSDFLTVSEHQDSRLTVHDVRKFICPKLDKSILTEHTSVNPSLTYLWCTILKLWFYHPRSTTMSQRFSDSKLLASVDRSFSTHQRVTSKWSKILCKLLRLNNWRKGFRIWTSSSNQATTVNKQQRNRKVSNSRRVRRTRRKTRND